MPVLAKRLPTQMVIAAYTAEDTVDKIETAFTSLEGELHMIVCTNMAIAKKDIANKLQIKELGNPHALETNVKKSITVEHLIQSMGLMLLGESGANKGIEADKKSKKDEKMSAAALARLSLRKVEGFDKARLHKIGNALGPGNSAIILVFDEIVIAKDRYDGLGFAESTDDLVDNIAAKITEELKKGNDVAYHIMIGEDGFTSSRAIVGDDATNIHDIIMTQDGTLVSNEVDTAKGGTEVATETTVITKDTVTTARTALTKSVVAYEVMAIDEDGLDYEAGMVHKTTK